MTAERIPPSLRPIGRAALPLLALLCLTLPLGACSAGIGTGEMKTPQFKQGVEQDIEQGVEHDVEEARVDAARDALPEVFADIDPALLAGVEAPGAAAQAGTALWRAQVERAQRAQRVGETIDDRPLYWQRLAARRAVRAHCAANYAANYAATYAATYAANYGANCDALLDRFEWASRGAGDIRWNADVPVRVLVTGFDPFFLDREIGQSNPSGLAALLLDDRVLSANGYRAQVQSMLFPVRFADFDAGQVEALLGPLLADVDLLITISMGRDGFDLERFPGRRRSATAPDNRNVLTGADADNPLIPLLGDAPLSGPEFVEFSLPAAAMTVVDVPYPVRDNRTVTTLERGTFDAESLEALQDQTAVQGGGGGYLSNEISFRTVRLARARDLGVAVGHLHTPRIAGFDQDALVAITGQVEQLVIAAAGAVSRSSPDRRSGSSAP